MASADTLFTLTPTLNTPPATLYATLDTITETSTPNRPVPVLDFAGAVADEHADFWLTMPSYYDGGGLTFSYKYSMDGTVGTAVELEFRCHKLADSDDISSDLGMDTQIAAVLADTPIATIDDLNITTTIGLAHADADSPAAGDRICIRVSRDFNHAANADDLQLQEVLVLET